MDELDNIIGSYTNLKSEVPLHKEFEARKINLLLDQTSHGQAIAIAKDLYNAMIIREAYYIKLLGHHWGLDSTSL